MLLLRMIEREPASPFPFSKPNPRAVVLRRTLFFSAGSFLAVFLLAHAVVKLEPLFRMRPQRFEDCTPTLADRAPDFTLRSAAGDRYVLSRAIGTLPIVLQFGSLSCPMCTMELAAMENLAKKYKGQAEFVFIYGKEAHGAASAENRAQRKRRAATLRRLLPDFAHILVDELGTSVQMLYTSPAQTAPAPAFVIDRAGRIIAKMVVAAPPLLDRTLSRLTPQ